MSRIRSDLVGVVCAYVDDAPVVLKAGDEVPEGAEVGDHIIDPVAGDEVPEGAPTKPARGRAK